MTPEERALAAAFMAECWPTVREYHDGDPLPKRRVHRNPKSVDTAGDKARKGAA